jgi:hypothetical protein
VWAATAAANLELLGVLLGANYWPHYLIGLIPMVVLVAGLACSRWAPGHRWTRRVALACVVTTMLATPVGAVAVHTYRSHPYLVGRWVTASADHADTVVVPFSHANVIEASGLSSPYPYSWSLPVRTRPRSGPTHEDPRPATRCSDVGGPLGRPRHLGPGPARPSHSCAGDALPAGRRGVRAPRVAAPRHAPVPRRGARRMRRQPPRRRGRHPRRQHRCQPHPIRRYIP